MSLEGKYMIAFTKGMDVEEYEGPGSVVEHEMELHISAPGVIEGTLAGRGGGSRQFTGTLVGNRFEFTVQGGHGPQSGALGGLGGPGGPGGPGGSGGPGGPGGPGHHGPPKDAKPFFMTYAGTIAEDGTVEGTMTCTGRYEHPTVDKMTGHRL